MKTETFPEFCRRDPPPDLQRLAAEWRGYDNIPDAVLDRLPELFRKWNLRRIFRTDFHPGGK
jgi:hypothetical protein